MRVLIDGHNALNRLGLQGMDHADKRRALLIQVAEISKNATVFFDARNVGASRQGTRHREHGVSVHYCRHREADYEILEVVRKAHTARGLLVVSSDREVTGIAAQHGARVQSVEAFFSRPETPNDRDELKSGPNMSPDDFDLPDVVEW